MGSFGMDDGFTDNHFDIRVANIQKYHQMRREQPEIESIQLKQHCGQGKGKEKRLQVGAAYFLLDHFGKDFKKKLCSYLNYRFMENLTKYDNFVQQCVIDYTDILKLLSTWGIERPKDIPDVKEFF